MPTPISAHFTLEELTRTSQTGPDGRVLANEPGAAELHFLRALCLACLEPIRELWGCPIHVNSAFRCVAVERKVSGRLFGQHLVGQAADIVPVGTLGLVEAYERIWRSDLPYDQLLLEQAGEVRWIHVSHAAEAHPARRQALYSPDNGHSWVAYEAGVAGDGRLA
jgi:hypothetical protein